MYHIIIFSRPIYGNQMFVLTHKLWDGEKLLTWHFHQTNWYVFYFSKDKDFVNVHCKFCTIR